MIWEPTREFIEQTNVWRVMRRLGFGERESAVSWGCPTDQDYRTDISRT